jgi:HK97 family phage major capsid protein
MPYNSQITRTDAAALIPEEVSDAILNEVAGSNPLMQLSRRLPNMARAQQRMPVMSALATAYFVTGDTGLKQTSEVAWENKYIDAEELAVIVPIPQAVLDDADYDIWGQVKPELVKAFNSAIAGAVLFGTNIPASWTTNLGAAGLLARCTAAGHTISLAAYADAYEAILGETAAGVDGLYMLVEADEYGVNGNIAHMSMKGILRNLRDSNGNPIFKSAVQDPTRYELDGAPIFFPTDGSMVAASALQFAGDWSQLVYSMRQDITYKVLDQAVIQDAAGNIVYNLAQQDMVALRAVIRLGFALPNPINRMNQTAATRCAFAALTA